MRLACRIAKMLIELRVNKISSQNRHLFWRSYLQSIKERFSFDIELDFVQHKYERSVYLTAVSKDLIHTEISKLNVNITAEALMDICQSYPNLRKLSLQNIEIHGSISDITAYCGNLRELRITLNPEVKAAQYAPLAKLPNLTTFIISGVQEVGSIDLFFADMRRWHRPRSLQPLTVTIKDKIFKSPSVTFAAFNSLRYLKIYQYYKYNSEWDINFTAEYDLNDLSEDGNSINGSLATISVGQLVGLVFDRCKEEIVLTIDKISDIRKLGSLSKLPNFNSLLIRTDSCDVPFNQSKLQNLFRSLASNESIALKSCIIRNILLDRVGALELASITSIRFLKCELSEWRSVQFLSQLYNLEYLKINVHDSVDASTSRLVTYLLSTCQFDMTLTTQNVDIFFLKNEKYLHICMLLDFSADLLAPLAEFSDVTTVQLSGIPNPASLNRLFQSFATSNLCMIEELDLSKLTNHYFSDISKVAEIQTLRKLTCDIADLTGIEKLADLKKLEVLKIKTIGFGSLSSLFTKLAENNSIKCIKVNLKKLSREEVAKVSRIRSLKKLECTFANMPHAQSFTELANSSIEELIVCVESKNRSLLNLFSAFSSKSKFMLQRLEIIGKTLDLTEIIEVSKIPVLISLQVGSVDSLRVLTLNPLCKLQKLDLHFGIGSNECNWFAHLDTLESLKCALVNDPGVEVLANLINLKELIIIEAGGSLSELYQAFANKSLPVLQKLHTPITSSSEIHGISQIKSLKELNIVYRTNCDNLSDLGQLNELTSLSIAEKDLSKINSDSVLPIFQTCQILDFASFDFDNGWSFPSSFANDVKQILKSVRDPRLQRPLQLSLRSYCPEFYTDTENEYLDVFYLQTNNYGSDYDLRFGGPIQR